jgi:hypothetical protein
MSPTYLARLILRKARQQNDPQGYIEGLLDAATDTALSGDGQLIAHTTAGRSYSFAFPAGTSQSDILTALDIALYHYTSGTLPSTTTQITFR